MLKQNDMLSPDYNDEEGKVEINQDELIFTPAENVNYQTQVAAMAGVQPQI
jgi:hypothetical protein